MSPNTILLIEDHPLVSMMLVDMLTEHVPDLSIRKVSSIQESKQHRHENPRLVIFDLNLPDCAGFASAQSVRSLYPFSHLLAFTGNTQGEVFKKLEDMGIPWVCKTADHQLLLDAVL